MNTLKRQEVKIYPMMGINAVHTKHGGAWRLWLLSRLLDEAGSGWIKYDDLTNLVHELNLSRQLYKAWLNDALEVGLLQFKIRDGLLDMTRLWIVNTAIAARLVGTVRLGKPVIIKNYRRLLKKGWRSVLWGAYLMQNDKPRTQKSRARETLVSTKTQQRYQKQIKVKKIFNTAKIGKKRDYYNGFLEFDTRVIFERGDELIQKLPTTVIVRKYNYKKAPRGRHDKILRAFKTLSIYPARVIENADKLFFETSVAAGIAVKKYQKADSFDMPQEIFVFKSYKPIGGPYARAEWTSISV